VRRKFAGEHDPFTMGSLFDAPMGLSSIIEDQPEIGASGREEEKYGLDATSNKGKSVARVCCSCFSPRSEPMAFSEVGGVVTRGPPLSHYSGYLFRRHSTSRTVWERVFLVLFEHQLWAYSGRRHWTARTNPLENQPIKLDSLLLDIHGPTAEDITNLKPQTSQLPRHLIRAAIRKQVRLLCLFLFATRIDPMWFLICWFLNLYAIYRLQAMKKCAFAILSATAPCVLP